MSLTVLAVQPGVRLVLVTATAELPITMAIIIITARERNVRGQPDVRLRVIMEVTVASRVRMRAKLNAHSTVTMGLVQRVQPMTDAPIQPGCTNAEAVVIQPVIFPELVGILAEPADV